MTEGLVGFVYNPLICFFRLTMGGSTICPRGVDTPNPPDKSSPDCDMQYRPSYGWDSLQKIC